MSACFVYYQSGRVPIAPFVEFSKIYSFSVNWDGWEDGFVDRFLCDPFSYVYIVFNCFNKDRLRAIRENATPFRYAKFKVASCFYSEVEYC